jgi:3D (Asp-Asp-Asp) domain-containing protein
MRFLGHISQRGNKTIDFRVKMAFFSLFSLTSLLFPQYSVAGQFGQIFSQPDKYEFTQVHFSQSKTNNLPIITNRQFEVTKTIYTTVTAYSSSVDECGIDPFTMASGERVFDGAIAHQYLPFNTKVRFPEVFGEKIFVVKDRLGPQFTSYYHVDMWVHSKAEAKAWGARVVKMEILN